MGTSDTLQSLADVIGAGSSHDLEIIAKTLSYLGISTLPSESFRNRQPLLTISVEHEQSDETVQARFDPDLKEWSIVPSQDVRSNLLPTRGNNSPLHDWTSLLPNTPHVDFLKSRNWSATALGPMSSWSSPLQLMTMKMLSDPRPANLYVGPDRVSIYNEPFSIIAASRHPFMMAATCETALPATWPFLSQIFNEIERTGEAFSVGEFEMSVEKVAGFLEEYTTLPVCPRVVAMLT